MCSFQKMVNVIALLFLLAACSINPTIIEHQDIIEKAPIEQAPLVAPSRSASTMREALACMDRMLVIEQIPSTLIAVKSIPDASGIFMTSTREMIITALSRMSRTSHAFRVVDYEIDALKQDTVQVLTGLLLANNQMELRKPEIYISGAISFGDKTVVTKRSSIGVSTKNTDSGYSWDVMGTMVGLDLHLGDMNSRTLFPGIDSANELAVASGGKAIELGGRISGLPRHIYELGMQFERASENNQGAGAAIRLLVDLATLELIGKWTRLPYWNCIGYEQNHPEFKRQMRTWYEDLSGHERIAIAQRVLEQEGFWSDEIDGEDSLKIRQAIANYQSAMDIIPSGKVNFETYTSLLGGYVGISSDSKLYPENMKWGMEFEDAVNGLAFNKPKADEISISILAHRDPVTMSIGDNIVMRITPSRTGYLYCYYKDALGVVTQIYPNPLQRILPVIQGQHSVLIPDITQSNEFLIEATKEGEESLYCALTLKPLIVSNKNLIAGNLEPLNEIKNLDEIQKIFHATGQVVSSGWYSWRVDFE